MNNLEQWATETIESYESYIKYGIDLDRANRNIYKLAQAILADKEIKE